MKMSRLTFEQNKYLEDVCNEMLKDAKIRFVGVINNMGHLVAGGLQGDIEPYETEEKRRMMYMQLRLDVSMRQEYNDTLGSIDYIASKRGKVLMVSVPIYDYVILISAEPHVDTETLANKTKDLFEICKSATI
jgi:hypothetical protein